MSSQDVQMLEEYIEAAKVWQYDDAGDVRGVITEDIQNTAE